ncbi:DUF3857 domain-containing protein [Pedobacter metabolipauper]|uniref:Uncharacterized protein DUF3857 n=1 Tax=Pedobacter metabolipauper TaxID=425513 RepID=A0A4R6SSN0_9SPHI|nr:DUF3857 domain-containing protein [Pedobacter metabolipauper]TDQ06418.1 uncharacterized protein DUF3857 [Pedobacter metabolipauper]
MKITKFIAPLLLVFCAISVSAQDKQTLRKKFEKYGVVELSEFKTTVSGPDSAASAVVLFDTGVGYFEPNPSTESLNYIFERHIRYKIFSKAGYDYANLELRMLQYNGRKTELKIIDGATYNLDNGKIVISKLNKEAKFSEQEDKNYTLEKFALPNIKEGSIIEFKYKISSDFLFSIDPWYFQRKIPTLYSNFSIIIPSDYQYKEITGGYIELNRTEPNKNYLNTQGVQNNFPMHLEYVAKNVPALKSESYITTMEDHVSKVEYELSSYKIPGKMFYQVTSSWPLIAKELKDELRFGYFIRKTGNSKIVVKDLIKDEKNPDTVVKKILDHVKNNLMWNGNYNFFTSELSLKAVFDKKSGNSADVNLSLMILLKEAGIEVLPVLISTRSNGTHPGYPMLSKFNSLILQVKIGEKYVLLDATTKNSSPDIIAYEHLNHFGLKVNAEKEVGEWISLEPQNISKKTTSYVLSLGADHKLSGKLFITATNYHSLSTRNKYLSSNDENDFLKNYKSNKPGLQITNYKIENVNAPYQALNETMDVVIEDHMEEAGNVLYFNPLLFDKTEENPFKSEERNFPVDFAFPHEETYRISLDLPKEYEVEKMPKTEKFTLPEGAATFSFVAAQQDNKIAITSKITINRAVFTSEEYHYLKELFKSIVRKQAEQLIIKKI